MNKKLISFLLAVVMIFSLCCFAYADAETEDAASTAESAGREDGLPDIDIYSWEYILANKYNGVGSYNAPAVSYFYGQGIDSRIYENAVDLVESCRAEGNPCYIVSAYRDFGYCINNAQTLMKYYFDDDPCAYAASTTVPGCNEHQLGLSFDITANPGYADNYDAIVAPIDEEAQYSAAWEWMKEHCAEYGFIVRYPEGKEEFYGQACNSTHLRYVGVEAAKYISENNLCLEEFLMLYGVKVNLPK